MEIVLACAAESIQAGNNSYSISVAQFSDKAKSVCARKRLKKKLVLYCVEFWVAIKLFVLNENSAEKTFGTNMLLQSSTCRMSRKKKLIFCLPQKKLLELIRYNPAVSQSYQAFGTLHYLRIMCGKYKGHL